MSDIKPFVKLYRDMGFNVMPILPRSKEPPHKKWGIYKEKKCEEDIPSDYNAAVIFKPPFALIDLDSPSLTRVFTNFEELKKKTLVVQSGKKGYHIYVRHNNSFPTNPRLIHPETKERIDIQVLNTYALIAGSIHPDTGEEYKIISSTLSIEEMNLDLFVKTLVEKHGFRRTRKTMHEIREGIEEGERDDSLFRYACYLRGIHGINDKMIILHELEKINKKSNPPLSHSQVLKCVDQAFTYTVDESKKIHYADVISEKAKGTLVYDGKGFWEYLSAIVSGEQEKIHTLELFCVDCKMDFKPSIFNMEHKGHQVQLKG